MLVAYVLVLANGTLNTMQKPTGYACDVANGYAVMLV